MLKSIAVLRGGAKQAAFGTDVSPKLLIMAGLTCGNPIFNSLFQDESFTETRGKNVVLNVEAMKEIITDYSDRIVTPVYLGIRTGYMKNEDQIRELENTPINGIKFVVYGLLTNPSNEILSEISKIYDLNFEYVELGIEGPEGNPQIINKKKNEIVGLLQKLHIGNFYT